MGRLHLFEFLDQSWFPAFLRDGMTAYLHTVEQKLSLRPFADKVRATLAATGQTRIVDLGSGSGGPILQMLPQLRIDAAMPELRLTDLYPNASAAGLIERAGSNVVYDRRPIDATRLPDDLTGMRTLFEVLHHFRPQAARRILADAFKKRMPIGVFELTRRAPATLLTAPLIILLVLLLTPAIRPLRWHQLVFTYLIPVLPLLIFWDGCVSHLRTYSEAELHQLVRGMDVPDYQWEICSLSIKGIPVKLPYLIGKPVAG